MAIRNPYPGLRPFEESDAHLFFGRADAVNELRKRLRKHRFLAVVGLSGSGKSSLIRAGLLPALHLGAMGDEFADWRVATFQPGMDPIGALSAALDDPDVLGPDPQGRAVLERSSRGLAERALRASLADGSYLLVFVDQFEEIFRFKKERPQASNDAALFVRLLLEASREKWSRVHVLITMRSDFLGECSQFSGLPEALGRCQYLVRGMTLDQRTEAIVKPARVAHLDIADELVQQVLNDAGEDPAQLPVLQHALMRTCDAGAPGPLLAEHYETAGTMAHALDRHAQNIFDGLSQADQRAARRMFRCLAERRAGARDTRRPTTLKKIAAVAGVPEGRIGHIYRQFSGAGRTFLTCRNPRVSPVLAGHQPQDGELTSSSLIDVSHESLLHLWKLLNQWIDWEEDLGRRFTALAEGLVKHANDVLEGNSLDRAEEWLKDVQQDLPDDLPEAEKQRALEAWAERYPVRHGEIETLVAFSDVKQLIDRSRAAAEQTAKRRESEERWQRYLYQAVALLVIVAGLVGVAFWRASIKSAELKLANDELTKVTTALTKETHEKAEAAARANQAANLAERREQEAKTEKAKAERLQLDALKQRDAEANAKLAVTAANARTEKALATATDALAKAEVAREDAQKASSEANRQRDAADKARRSALSRLFFARSEALRTQRASLLPVSVAVGLVGIQYSNSDPELIKQAGEAWRRALTLLPIQAGVVPMSPEERPVGFAFSRKGDLLATVGVTSKSSTLRLWTIQGRQVNEVFVDMPLSEPRFSPDGKYLAALAPNAAVIWDVTERAVRSVPHSDTVNTLAFAHDSKTFATGSDDMNACIWKSEDARRVRCLRHPGEEYVTALDFSPDNQRLVTGTDEKWVRVWNVGTGQQLFEMRPDPTKPEEPSHQDRVNAVRFAPRGATVASASSDRTVRLWDATNGRQRKLLSHSGPVSRVEYSANGEMVASAGDDNTVQVWTVTGRQVATLAHENQITAIGFSPDGRYVATAGADNTGRVWDTSRGTERWRAVHDGTVLGISFSADGKYFATASTDRTARVWQIPEGGGSRALEAGAVGAAFGGRDRIVALGSDRDVRIIDASQPAPLPPIRGPFDRIALSQDGRYLAVAASSNRDNKGISVIEVDSNRAVPVQNAGNPSVTAIALDLRGRHVAVANMGRVTITDVQGKKELPYKLEHGRRVASLAFSPDGSYVATGSVDGTAVVWDVETGARLATLKHDRAEFVIAVAFSSDGALLATGSDETLARVWNWREERELKKFRHSDDVVAVTFDRAGRRLATASDDNAARVWDINSGEEENRFPLGSPGRAVAFSSDDSRLNTVSLNGVSGSWSLLSDDLVTEACSRLPRPLTPAEWTQLIGDELPYRQVCATSRAAGGS